jgi:hypothetical protein
MLELNTRFNTIALRVRRSIFLAYSHPLLANLILFQQISSLLGKSHPLATNLISTNFIPSRQISSPLGGSHSISANLISSQQNSSPLGICHLISANVIPSRQMLSPLGKCYPLSPNFISSWKISSPLAKFHLLLEKFISDFISFRHISTQPFSANIIPFYRILFILVKSHSFSSNPILSGKSHPLSAKLGKSHLLLGNLNSSPQNLIPFRQNIVSLEYGKYRLPWLNLKFALLI